MTIKIAKNRLKTLISQHSDKNNLFTPVCKSIKQGHASNEAHKKELQKELWNFRSHVLSFPGTKVP